MANIRAAQFAPAICPRPAWAQTGGRHPGPWPRREPQRGQRAECL